MPKTTTLSTTLVAVSAAQPRLTLDQLLQLFVLSRLIERVRRRRKVLGDIPIPSRYLSHQKKLSSRGEPLVPIVDGLLGTEIKVSKKIDFYINNAKKAVFRNSSP